MSGSAAARAAKAKNKVMHIPKKAHKGTFVGNLHTTTSGHRLTPAQQREIAQINASFGMRSAPKAEKKGKKGA